MNRLLTFLAATAVAWVVIDTAIVVALGRWVARREALDAVNTLRCTPTPPLTKADIERIKQIVDDKRIVAEMEREFAQ